MSIVADQRKKTTQPARTNVANKNSKKQTQPTQPTTQNPKVSASTAISSNSSSNPPKSKSPPPPPPQPKQQQQQQTNQGQEHVPIKGFNAIEVDELLSRGVDPQAEVYKPDQSSAQKPGPWGQKAGTMATGKDFWLELRRQVATLQKGGSTNKGG